MTYVPLYVESVSRNSVKV